MPIHEFVCKKCGHSFEHLLTLGEIEDKSLRCPECNSKKLKRIFSSFSVSKLPSFGGGRTCCGSKSPEDASCDGPGSCCSKKK